MKVFAKKIGMTHVEEGFKVKPLTILDVTENVIAKVADGKVWLGWGKKRNATKAQVGAYKDLGFAPARVMEVALKADEAKVGVYEVVDLPAKVDVTATSKGKGFAGVVKRHGFSGVGGETHGASDRVRAPGSIGAGTTPGRVFKGKKMAGRMGNETVTTKKLPVIKQMVDGNRKLVLVKGAVPGPNGGLIQISW